MRHLEQRVGIVRKINRGSIDVRISMREKGGGGRREYEEEEKKISKIDR